MEDQVRVSLRSVEGCGSNGQIEHYLTFATLTLVTSCKDPLFVAKCPVTLVSHKMAPVISRNTTYYSSEMERGAFPVR